MRCQQALQTLSAPLQAAQPAMDQWEVHIGAMNKLVVGAISLDQANAFWNQTRVGAQHRITAFRSAMGAMRRTGVDCPAPGTLPRDSTPALRSCATRVAADLRALGAARTAIGTWNMHVSDMERLRTGKLSGTKAGEMWLSMWHRGQQQVRDYRAAVRDANSAGACDGSSTAGQGTAPSAPSSPMTDMPGMG
jgi:hypothetical protein